MRSVFLKLKAEENASTDRFKITDEQEEK